MARRLEPAQPIPKTFGSYVKATNTMGLLFGIYGSSGFIYSCNKLALDWPQVLKGSTNQYPLISGWIRSGLMLFHGPSLNEANGFSRRCPRQAHIVFMPITSPSFRFRDLNSIRKHIINSSEGT